MDLVLFEQATPLELLYAKMCTDLKSAMSVRLSSLLRSSAGTARTSRFSLRGKSKAEIMSGLGPLNILLGARLRKDSLDCSGGRCKARCDSCLSGAERTRDLRQLARQAS